jgi:hypothetical protein
MPPPNQVTGVLERLAKEQTEMLRNWVLEGANWPEDAPPLIARKAQSGSGTDEGALVADIYQRVVANSPAVAPQEMQPYTGAIAGTEVTFEMVPIPGGTFQMGSPDSEPGRKPDEGPQRPVEIAPFWMGKHEVTWDEFELFMYPNEEKKARATKSIDPALNALTDATTRPTQPYVEMSFGMGKEGYPSDLDDPACSEQVLPVAERKDGPVLPAPDRSRMGIRRARRHTTPWSWGDDPKKAGEYAWYGKNSDSSIRRSARRSRIPGAFSTCTAMCWSGRSISMTRLLSALFRREPVEQSDAGLPAFSARWFMGRRRSRKAPQLRAARVRQELEDSGPAAAEERLVPYGCAISRLPNRAPGENCPTAAEMQQYWNSGVEKDTPGLSKEAPQPQ